MNEVQLFDFNNQNIRTIVIDDIVWFLGTDVAGALGYSNRGKAILNHVAKHNTKTLSPKGFPKMGKAKIWNNPNDFTKKKFINQSGIFSLALTSKLDKAIKFHDWVTDKVLPSINETGSYSIQNDNNLSKQLQSTYTIKKIVSRIDDLENNMTINTHEAHMIKKSVNRKIVPLLGGKHAKTYKKYARKTYSDMWVSFKDYFALTSYKDLPRKQLRQGLNFVQTWQPRLELQSEINSYNNQIDLF